MIRCISSLKEFVGITMCEFFPVNFGPPIIYKWVGFQVTSCRFFVKSPNKQRLMQLEANRRHDGEEISVEFSCFIAIRCTYYVKKFV